MKLCVITRSSLAVLLAGALTGCSSLGVPLVKKDARFKDPIAEEIDYYLDKETKKTPKFFTDFAYFWLRVENYNKSTQLFNDALELDETYTPAYLGLAKVYQKLERYEDALETLNTGMQHCGPAPPLWNELAMVKVKMEDYPGAIEAMTIALEGDPHNSLYATNIANMYAVIGEYDKALNWYTLAMTPADAHYRIAGIVHNQGHYQLSQHHLQLALQSNPEHKEVLAAMQRFGPNRIQQVEYTTPAESRLKSQGQVRPAEDYVTPPAGWVSHGAR